VYGKRTKRWNGRREGKKGKRRREPKLRREELLLTRHGARLCVDLHLFATLPSSSIICFLMIL